MLNTQQSTRNQTDKPENYKFDLEKRTLEFAKRTTSFVKELSDTSINRPLIEQLIRSSSSIGANYHEATEAESKSDFIHKISISKKESKETKYWLDLILSTNQEYESQITPLLNEVKELILIFSKSILTSRNKNKYV